MTCEGFLLWQVRQTTVSEIASATTVIRQDTGALSMAPCSAEGGGEGFVEVEIFLPDGKG